MTISFTPTQRVPANTAVVAYGINSDKFNNFQRVLIRQNLKNLALKVN